MKIFIDKGPILVLFIMLSIASYTSANKKTLTYQPSLACRLGHPLLVKYPSIKKTCCSYVTGKMTTDWTSGNYHLTSYLTELKTWNCTEFVEECKYKSYAFTEFTRVVYKKFCNETGFRSECSSILEKESHNTKYTSPNISSNNINVTDNTWASLVTSFRGISISDSAFQEPCLQVAMYDLPGRKPYHEVINVLVPFCGFVWCGMETGLNDFDEVSDWTCLPTRCRINLIIIVIVIIILSILVIGANTMVLTVFIKSEKLKNGQAFYKISIAVADLLAGVVVLPTFVSTFYFFLWQKHMNADSKTLNNSTAESSGISEENMPDSTNYVFPDGKRAPLAYYDFVGFFTTLSLSVSIYTLMAAGFDRLLAIAIPMKYFKLNTKRIAIYVIISIWVLGAIFSILPPTVDGLQYSVVASTMISLSGGNAPLIYAILFILPVLTVWGTSIALFFSMKKHAKDAQQVRGNSATSSFQQTETEKKLAQTLGLMVGVFSINLLPAIVVLITGLIWPNIHYANLKELDEASASAYISMEFFAVIVLMSNSLWNCLIYSVRNEDFRNEARYVLRRSTDFIRLSTKRHIRSKDRPVVYNNYRESPVGFRTDLSNPKNLGENGCTFDTAFTMADSPVSKPKAIGIKRFI